MDMYMDMFMWVPLHFLFYGALRLHGSMCLQAPACVSFRDPCIAFTVVLFTCRVNVNTTDATTGATALLLPAQNTHTLHDPMCESRACGNRICMDAGPVSWVSK